MPRASEQVELKPAVPIKKSITDQYIVSLEDGRKFKSMKRYLGLLGMTPDDYRAKWGLPRDYPMVAPGYAAKRSELAKATGLGSTRRKLEAGKGKAEPIAPSTGFEEDRESAEPRLLDDLPVGPVDTRIKRRGRPKKAYPAVTPTTAPVNGAAPPIDPEPRENLSLKIELPTKGRERPR